MTKYISIIVLSLLTLSCSVRKKSKVQATQTAEMALNVNVEKSKLQEFGASSYMLRDTSLKVAQRNLKDTLSKDAVKPVFDAQGKGLPNTTNMKGSGVSVKLTALPSGQLAVDATCDSLDLLVKGLITERNYYAAQAETSQSNGKVLKTSSRKTEEMKTKSTRLLPWWGWVLLTVALVVALTIFFLKKYKKGIGA